jgi:hypothetical protein
MFTALFMMSCYSCGDFYPILHTSKDKDRMAWLAEISDLLYEIERDGWEQVQSESARTEHYICPLCIENAWKNSGQSLEVLPF